MSAPIALALLPRVFAIGRLSGRPPLESVGEFLWICRDSNHYSVVFPADAAPPHVVPDSANWRALRLQGPLDFSLSGVLVRVLAPLADAGISVLVASSVETDTILIPEDRVTAALAALCPPQFLIGPP